MGIAESGCVNAQMKMFNHAERLFMPCREPLSSDHLKTSHSILLSHGILKDIVLEYGPMTKINRRILFSSDVFAMATMNTPANCSSALLHTKGSLSHADLVLLVPHPFSLSFFLSFSMQGLDFAVKSHSTAN